MGVLRFADGAEGALKPLLSCRGYLIPLMRLRVDSSPSMWMVRGLRAILSITASATAPFPSFACHADGANRERSMSDPVRSFGLMGSVVSRVWLGLVCLGG